MPDLLAVEAVTDECVNEARFHGGELQHDGAAETGYCRVVIFGVGV